LVRKNISCFLQEIFFVEGALQNVFEDWCFLNSNFSNPKIFNLG